MPDKDKIPEVYQDLESLPEKTYTKSEILLKVRELFNKYEFGFTVFKILEAKL